MELYSLGVQITYALSPMAFCYKSEYRTDLVFKWDLKRRIFAPICCEGLFLGTIYANLWQLDLS